MSFSLHGIPVSRGIAIGRAYLMAPAALDVDHYLVDPPQIESEIERFRAALKRVQGELDRLSEHLSADAPSEVGAFINVHTMILNDAMLVQETMDLIRTRRYNVEWALTEQLERLSRHFDDIEDEYLRERKADVRQVVERILKALAGAPSVLVTGAHADSGDDMIVVAHDISPADMLQFKTQTFQGFVTDLGGRTSHTAIVARSLGIPAAVGVGHASALIRQDDLIIVDGDRGIVIVDPAPIVLEEYSYRQSEKLLEQKKLQRLKFSPTQTLCGTKISLLANIELPEDARAAVEAGAVGVGLFRTEFLFMNHKDRLPEEEEQFEAYKRAVELMGGLPVTIRTIDVGADKPLDTLGAEGYESAPNPALGLRAIRWSLSEPQMFLTQLRAILRASASGQVRILVPMLAHAQEIDQTLDLIREAKRQLDDAGLPYDPGVQIGAMIEIPAAAIALPLFLKRVDFLSIGTNDLIQYTLAIDRADNAVAHLYDPLHPAVLHLIAFTLREAKRAGVPVSVCGEMAGDPQLTRLLLGMGLTEFSMHPSQLLVVKQEILRANLAALEKPAADVLAAFEPEEVQAALRCLGQV